jgi:hypothetical protein
VRVTGSEKVKEKDTIVGMQCNCEVQNNKIDGTTYSSFSFFTSNGAGECPIGLDLVREAAEEAKERGWLKTSKGEVLLDTPDEDEERLGRNMPEAISTLRANEKYFNLLVENLNNASIREAKEG